MKAVKIPGPNELAIFHRGPALDLGPLPALFYFALSGEDSLQLDPFNQPVEYLKNDPIRVISFNIPFHGPGYENKQAIFEWAKAFKLNQNFLEVFFSQALENISFLIEKNIIDPNQLAVAGLSRGGFIALHLAARETRLKYILGFAPLTNFALMDEFHTLQHHPILEAFSLNKIMEQLVGKQLRFYIGNRDLRVSTRSCFDYIYRLTDLSYDKGFRSPPIELFINPSVGFKGHGTLPPVFAAGAQWIKTKLAP